MSFFENTRDPKGFGGRLMVTMMNLAHTPVALWGASLSASCAGRKGAGLRLRRRGEYQTAAEKVSARHRKGCGLLRCQRRKNPRRLNAAAIQRIAVSSGRGSVQRIIFASDWFDAVTAFETVYFWPDPAKCFREVWRVLKPGGTFLICNEVNGDTDKDKNGQKSLMA